MAYVTNKTASLSVNYPYREYAPGYVLVTRWRGDVPTTVWCPGDQPCVRLFPDARPEGDWKLLFGQSGRPCMHAVGPPVGLKIPAPSTSWKFVAAGAIGSRGMVGE